MGVVNVNPAARKSNEPYNHRLDMKPNGLGRSVDTALTRRFSLTLKTLPEAVDMGEAGRAPPAPARAYNSAVGLMGYNLDSKYTMRIGNAGGGNASGKLLTTGCAIPPVHT